MIKRLIPPPSSLDGNNKEKKISNIAFPPRGLLCGWVFITSCIDQPLHQKTVECLQAPQQYLTRDELCAVQSIPRDRQSASKQVIKMSLVSVLSGWILVAQCRTDSFKFTLENYFVTKVPTLLCQLKSRKLTNFRFKLFSLIHSNVLISRDLSRES